MQLGSAILTLFLIMDPVGNVPAFVSYLKGVETRRRTWVVARESVFALLILLFFLFFGPQLTELLHIQRPAIYLAGGVLLFLISLYMIFPGASVMAGAGDEQGKNEPFIVPLATPFFAGPSAMATLMIFVSKEPDSTGKWLVALVIAWGLSAAILLCSPLISRLLGEKGLRASEKLMGMILTVISIQMLLDGINLFIDCCRQ